MRRIVAVEVQAALADCDHAGMRRDPLQFIRVAEVPGMVRVNADRAVKIELLGDLRGAAAFLHRSAGDDHRLHAVRAGTGDHVCQVRRERGVCQVRADVDHSLPCGSPRPRRILRPLITSFTVPESGRLRRARSASCRTMLMSFSAHGMPERSAIESIAQFCALPWLRASLSFAGLTPSASPRRRPSSFAEMHAQRMRLLTILPTCPAPAGPRWKM